MSATQYTGVKEHDASQAQNTTRDVVALLVAAAMLADRRGAARQQATAPKPEPEVEPVEIETLDNPVEALTGQPERAGLNGIANGESLPGQADPHQLPGGPDEAAIAPVQTNPPGPTISISIKVGNTSIESPLNELADTLYQQDPETLEQLRAAIQDEARGPDAPTVEIRADEQLKFYRDSDNTFVSPDFDIHQSSPEIVQLPLSQAEAFVNQDLAQSSTTGNSDVWAAQTQVPMAEVDPQGRILRPTTAIAQSIEANADKVELTNQREETAENYDEWLGERRKHSDERANAYDKELDARRAAADAKKQAQIPDQQIQIAGMLSQACDMCFVPNSGKQEIQGRHFTIIKEGDSLTVTAKDGRGEIFQKSGNEIQSSLTPKDVDILSRGFEVLKQRQGATQKTTPSIPRPKGIELE